MMSRILHIDRRLAPVALVMALLLPLLNVSCRSAKPAGPSTGTYQPSSATALSNRELKDLFGKLEGSYLGWEEMRVPVTLSLKRDRKSVV